MVTLTTDQYRSLLTHFLGAESVDDQLLGLLVIGPAGVGKTSISRDVARELGWDVREVYLGNMADPGDVRGLPVAGEGRTDWLVSAEFVPPARPTVLLLDEITRAPVYLHSIIVTLITSCSVGPGHKLDPALVKVIATGNPSTEEYSGCYELDLAVRSRFYQVGLVADWTAWFKWVQSRTQEPFRLHVAGAVATAPELQNAASPRDWWHVVRLATPDRELLQWIVESKVPGAAAPLQELLQSGDQLPPVEQLAGDPEAAVRIIEGLPVLLQGWAVKRAATVMSSLPVEKAAALVAALLTSGIRPELKAQALRLAPQAALAAAAKQNKGLVQEVQKAHLDQMAEVREFIAERVNERDQSRG